KLQDAMIRYNGPDVPDGPAKSQTRSYAEIALLLLRQPKPDGGPESWHLRTRDGDDLVLCAGELPKLSGRLSRGMTALWVGKEVRLPADEILSVYRVPKGP